MPLNLVRVKTFKSVVMSCTLAALWLFSLSSSAQMSLRDSSIIIPHLDVVYSIQIPGGDLVDRFGYFHTIGSAFYVKDRKGFIYGFDGQYQFGDQVKENTISNLLTDRGQLIDGDGEYAALRVFMRGFRFSAQFGKVFSEFLAPNPNSGFKVLIGAGLWQHRIRIEDIQQNAPQIKFPYQKGYDRMTNGFALNQFVGYQYFSDSRLLNFYFGMEFNQGFTQNRRAYNFSEKRKDDVQRIDFSYGFKVGWVIPFYRRAPKEFYYD
jgi:hypothetical protein